MKAGWLSSEYHWMSWALSCLQAKQVFGAVHLETDARGREILMEKLQLPYDSVSTTLEKRLDDYHPALFALAKILTYSNQSEPFLHLDSDVFLWHKPDSSLLEGKLIAQNMDKNLPFYLHNLTEINRHLQYVPPLFAPGNFVKKDIYGSNAGVMGGNYPEFFQEYSRIAFDFIDGNKDCIDKVDTGGLNFIFEQYLFFQLAQSAGIPVGYLKGVVDDPVFKDYINFENFPHTDLIHPVGGFKKMRHVCEHVAKKLRNDYPEYYYRVIDLVRLNNKNMLSAVYYVLNDHQESLTNKDAVKSETSPFPFVRTQAALNYLKKQDRLCLEIDPALFTEETFVDTIKVGISNEDERDCLIEIFRLEHLKNLLRQRVFGHELSVNARYSEDKLNYSNIQSAFSMNDEAIMKLKIKSIDDLEYTDLEWDWKYDDDKEADVLAERNLNQSRSSLGVLLIPRVLQLDIREYYVDELDYIVFNALSGGASIISILKDLEQYFSEEELEEDYASFKFLVIKTLKQLLYAGAAKIIVK